MEKGVGISWARTRDWVIGERGNVESERRGVLWTEEK